MKRVVITGMGIVSSIGNSTQEVTASGLDDDVAGLAGKLAEQARDFYERQGWLQGSVEPSSAR